MLDHCLKNDILNAHFAVSTSARDVGTLSSWNWNTVCPHSNVYRLRAACLGRANKLQWWTELCSPYDWAIHAAWSRSWASINTWCRLSFSGYFYILNIKPQGLFLSPEANWPSLACIRVAKVTVTEESDCIWSTTGNCSLFRLTPEHHLAEH